ncbi:DUF1566 domain-containing protein [Parabacteroides leei]|uniref:Lcl domain-containing protein n=3 Tax=Parabacteroides leei TaxID=2939491 RepID=UPI003D3157FD
MSAGLALLKLPRGAPAVSYKWQLRTFVSNWYWSSTVYSSGKHWIVNFNNGNTNNNNDTNNNYVRCVRDSFMNLKIMK